MWIYSKLRVGFVAVVDKCVHFKQLGTFIDAAHCSKCKGSSHFFITWQDCIACALPVYDITDCITS